MPKQDEMVRWWHFISKKSSVNHPLLKSFFCIFVFSQNQLSAVRMKQADECKGFDGVCFSQWTYTAVVHAKPTGFAVTELQVIVVASCDKTLSVLYTSPYKLSQHAAYSMYACVSHTTMRLIELLSLLSQTSAGLWMMHFSLWNRTRKSYNFTLALYLLGL